MINVAQKNLCNEHPAPIFLQNITKKFAQTPIADQQVINQKQPVAQAVAQEVKVVPSAAESIAAIKAMLGKRGGPIRFQKAFYDLSDRNRAIVFASAGLPQSRRNDEFSSFSEQEVQAICTGIQTLAFIARTFEQSFGNLRGLHSGAVM